MLRIFVKTLKQFIMTKEQIIDLIKAQEAELYKELLECYEYRDARDAKDLAIFRASAAWFSVNQLLEKIEENEND
jgi:hypothetical protein